MKPWIFGATLLLVTARAQAQDAFEVEPPTDSVGKIGSPSAIQNEEIEFRQKLQELQKKEMSFKAREEEMAKLVDQYRKKVGEGGKVTLVPSDKPSPSKEISDPYAGKFRERRSAPRKPAGRASGGALESPASGGANFGALVFVAEGKEGEDENVTWERTIPAGTFIKAKIASGGEFVDNELTPSLVQLEHTAMLPNGKRYNLKGCHAIMKGRARLSVERAYFQGHKLSCTRTDGRSFETTFNTYLADKDNNHGVRGVYISRQGQVLSAAVLAKLVKGLGEGLELAQMSTKIAGTENPVAVKDFTGKLGLMLAGKSSAEAASMVADFYLEHAKNLMPAIGVGSGEDVWVVAVDGFNLPEDVAPMEGLYND